jgi:hypothetical protein
MCPEDCTPEDWQAYLELMQRMTPGEKLSRTLGLSELACDLAKAELRRRYPGEDERAIFLRFACLNLGPELFRKAYQIEPRPETDNLPPLSMDEFGRQAERLGREALLRRARHAGAS